MIEPILILFAAVALLTGLFYLYMPNIYKVNIFSDHILIKTMGFPFRKIYFSDICGIRISSEPYLDLENGAIDLERDYFDPKIVIIAKNKGIFSNYYKYRIFYLHSNKLKELKEIIAEKLKVFYGT